MVGIKKLISILFATIFVLQLSQVIKSTEAALNTYVWTGASTNCANDGVTVCDFDDADNWTPPAGFPGMPKDATEYFDVLIDGKGFNYSIKATNDWSYKIDNLMIGYNPKKRSTQENSVSKRYDSALVGVKLTFVSNLIVVIDDFHNVYMGSNSHLILETPISIGIGAYNKIVLNSGVKLEIRKTFGTNTTFTFDDAPGYEFHIRDGSTFNFYQSNGNAWQNLTGPSGSSVWRVEGTFNSYSSNCELIDSPEGVLILSHHGSISCKETRISPIVGAGFKFYPSQISIYNNALSNYSAIATIYNTYNIYNVDGLGINDSGISADGGKIRIHSNTLIYLHRYYTIPIRGNGVIEFYGNVEAGVGIAKKRGDGPAHFQVEYGKLVFYQDLTIYNNYGISMVNGSGCAVYFKGNVYSSSPFDLEILGHVEIHKNYTNNYLRSLDGSSIVIGDGHINTEYPTQFVSGSLRVGGATFNKGMSLDAVSFSGYGTINGGVNFTNTPNNEITLSLDSGHTLTINGNLKVDKSDFVVYANSSSPPGYLVVNGDVAFSVNTTTFKFTFQGAPPSTAQVYKLLTYTGKASGIPNNITLPAVSAEASISYLHDTSSNPKQVIITYTPPPPPPVDPPTEPIFDPVGLNAANARFAYSFLMMVVLISSIFAVIFF